MRKSQFFVLIPQRIGGNVAGDHGLRPISRRAAGACHGTDPNPLHGAQKILGQPCSRCRIQTVAPQQRNHCQRSGVLPLDRLNQLRQDLLQRLAGGDHLERLQTILLEHLLPAPLGDIARNGMGAARDPVFEDQPVADFQHHTSAILGHDLQVGGGSRLAAQRLLNHLARRFQVLGRHQLRDIHFQRFGPGISADALRRPVDGGEITLQVNDVDQVAGVLHQLAIHLLAGAQRAVFFLRIAEG